MFDHPGSSSRMKINLTFGFCGLFSGIVFNICFGFFIVLGMALFGVERHPNHVDIAVRIEVKIAVTIAVKITVNIMRRAVIITVKTQVKTAVKTAVNTAVKTAVNILQR